MKTKIHEYIITQMQNTKMYMHVYVFICHDFNMSSLQYLSPLFFHGLAFCQIPTIQCNDDFDGGGDYDENGDDDD